MSSPLERSPLLRKAITLINKKQYNKAINILDGIQDSTLFPLKAYYLGLCATFLGDDTKAIDYYRNVGTIDEKAIGIPINEFLLNYYKNLGSVLYRYARKLINNKIIDLLEEVSINEGKKEGLTYKDALLQAVNTFELALKIDDSDISLWQNLGNVYLDLEEYEKSREIFKKIISMNQNIPAPYYCLALIHEKKNQYEKAINDLNKAYSLQPENKIYLIHLIENSLKVGTYQKALEFAKELNSLYPQSPKALGMLVKTYKALKNKEKALKYYNILNEKFPEWLAGQEEISLP